MGKLSTSKLYSFLGKINSKIEGTLGVFISYNRLKDNFVDAFRNGIRQNCILIHGKENIEDIIDGKVAIKDFLEYCYVMVSTKNRTDISTSEFMAIPNKSKFTTKSDIPIANNWLEIYKGLTGTTSIAEFTANLENWYSHDLNLSEKIINIYNSLNLDFLVQQKLDTLIDWLTEKEKDIFKNTLVLKFKSEHWKKYAHETFCQKLQVLGLVFDITDRTSITQNVISVLNGDWELENKATYVIDIYYNQLIKDEKITLIRYYLEIYCDSSRENRFRQKQFANKLFMNFGENYLEHIREKLTESIFDIKLSASVFDENADEVKKITFRRFKKYEKVFTENKENIEEFFNAEYDNS